MEVLMMITYILLIILSIYHGLIEDYDRGCFGLLLAYGIRLNSKDFN